MKKLILLMVIGICTFISGYSQVIITPSFKSITKDEALAFVKSTYPQSDADYYLIDEDNNSSYWLIFVDPSPISNWEHDCYTYKMTSI